MIRDVALAASGLLSREDVRPERLPGRSRHGIWNMPYNSDKWTTSEGEDRYRRSLYTFWRRTSPYPSFMTFDATSREFCTVRRVRTNTPLQALTLLERSGVVRGRAGAGAADDRRGRRRRAARTRAAFGVKLVLSRDAKPAELTRLVALYEHERRHYETLGAVDWYSADRTGAVVTTAPARQATMRTSPRGRWSPTCC